MSLSRIYANIRTSDNDPHRGYYAICSLDIPELAASRNTGARKFPQAHILVRRNLMDAIAITTIASATVSLLAPYLKSLGEELAKKAGEEIGVKNGEKKRGKGRKIEKKGREKDWGKGGKNSRGKAKKFEGDYKKKFSPFFPPFSSPAFFAVS